MRKTKRLMALLLSACMIFSSTGTNKAFADDLATNTDAQTTIEESYTEEEVTTEEVVVEPTEESVTTEEITEESTTEETIEADSKESDETKEGEVEESEFITFDHMYSDVDVSGINTKELFVETDNVSVFTKNTTVESNYDNVYIISFESIEEARFAYSYYIDKVNFISDISNVVTLEEETETSEEDVADMSNVNEGNDSLSNLNDISVKDYSGYIALIDSGVNSADAKLSVLDDDGSDTLGHGTHMYNYIKEENPNAKVVSIKAFNGNKTNIADVYAAIKLAIESKVSVINMSFVASDIENNAILKDIINEAIDNNIVVIGSAGNYSTSAYNYIPGSIERVITVGAVNEDSTLYKTSNYDADLYVVATSTSEAAARYSGIYTSENESDKVYIKYKDTNSTDTEELVLDPTLQSGVSYGAYPSPHNSDLPDQLNCVVDVIGDGTYAGQISGSNGVQFTVRSIDAQLNGTISVTASDINNNGLWDDWYSSGKIDASTYNRTSTYTDNGRWRQYVQIAYYKSALWWAGTPLGASSSNDWTIDFGTGRNGANYGVTCCEHDNSSVSFNSSGIQAGFIKVWDEDVNGKATAMYVGCFDAGSDSNGNPRQKLAVGFAVRKDSTQYRNYIKIKKTGVAGEEVVGCDLRVYDTNGNPLKNSANGSTDGKMKDNGDGTYSWWSAYSSTKDKYSTVRIKEITGGTSKNAHAELGNKKISYNNASNNNKWISTNGSLSNSAVNLSTKQETDTNPISGAYSVSYTATQTPTKWYYGVGITKVNRDNTSAKVPGCTIRLYKAQSATADNLIGTMTETSSGSRAYIWTSGPHNADIYPNTAYVYEVSAPTGIFNNTWNTSNNGKWLGTVSITKSETPVSPNAASNVFNQIPTYAGIDIVKIDGNTRTPIAGAVYEVYVNGTAAQKNGTLFKTVTTESDGHVAVEFNDYAITKAYAIEKSIPGNYVVDPTPFDLNITHTTSRIAKSNTTDTTQGNSHRVYAYLKKTSSNTSCTNNNPNYNLNGATYKVFRTQAEANTALQTLNYSAAIMTFTCDSNGNTTTQEINNNYLNLGDDNAILPTNFWVVESKAGDEGYIRSNTVKQITITSAHDKDHPYKIEVEDVPINDPFNLTIEKKDKLYDQVVSLEGTEFTLNFYDQDITTIRSAAWLKVNCTPKSTYKITVGADGKAVFNESLPRGFITIEETKLPEGYTMDDDFVVYLKNDPTKDITNNLVFVLDGKLKDNDTASEDRTWYPWSATTYAELATKGEEVTDSTQAAAFKVGIANPTKARADIELTKRDEVKDEPMANVKFRIKNVDTGEVHYIYTDENGYATTKVSKYTNVNYYDSVNDYDGTNATAWFKKLKDTDGSIKEADAEDGYPALVMGNYTIKEMSCAANKGRQLEPEKAITITVDDKNSVINVYDENATESGNKLWNTVKPTLKTVAIVKETSDAENKSKTLAQAGSNVDWKNQTIVDTISLEKLRNDTTYTLLSELMVVDQLGNVTPYLDKDGNPYKRVKTFTTAKDYKKSRYEINETQIMDLDSVDPTGLEEAQKALVVYETLYYGDYATVADLDEAIANNTIKTRYEEYDADDDMDFFPLEHKDPTDTYQTVYPGDIHTTIKDSVSSDKIAHPGETTKLIDTVLYTGLTPGETYTITGTIQVKQGTDWSKIKYDPTDPNADKDGYVYTTEKDDTQTSTDDQNSATTDDQNTDTNQSTTNDQNSNTTNDQNTNNDTTNNDANSNDDSTAPVDDTSDRAYTLRDAEGNPVTITVEFTPDKTTGQVDVEFNIDSSLLEGKSIVAFEELKYKDITIAVHNDLNDEDETVHYPKFKTTTWNSNITVEITEDNADSSKEVLAVAEGSSFTDTIHYHNLLANRTYVAKGVLMDKETGEELKDANGSTIVAQTTFKTPEVEAIVGTTSPNAIDYTNEAGEILDMSSDTANYTCDGDVDVVFEGYDLTTLANKTGVVFEDIYLLKEDGYDENGNTTNIEISVGEHHDITDVDQFIYLIDMHTKAVDSLTKEQIVAENIDTSIIDTVTYENVIPGKKYRLVATLKVVGDTTGKYKDGDTLLDENGNEVTAEIEFTPTEKNGTVDVEIPFNSSILIKGTDIVVFEDMYNSFGIKVATHTDLTDKDQTVHTPNGHTTALGKESKDHTIAADKEMTIIDTIYYENLIPGKEYTATGTIYRTDTKKPLEKNGKIITSTVKFTPKEKDGTVEVPITIDTSDLATKKLVVFEDVKYEDVTVFTHHDLEDEDQTVTVNMILGISIAKADKDNIKYFLKGAEITIYNQDGTIAKDINGKDCIGTTDANGNVEFEVMYQDNNTYYAQETKAPNGYTINSDKFEIKATGTKDDNHNDIIKITILDSAISIPPTPKTGDMLLIALFMALAIGISSMSIIYYRKKKRI